MYREMASVTVNRFKDGELGLIYIDGDHKYSAVKQDLDLWYPKIQHGGFIVGDDYSNAFPGVKRAVNEFVKKHNLKLHMATKRTYVIRIP